MKKVRAVDIKPDQYVVMDDMTRSRVISVVMDRNDTTIKTANGSEYTSSTMPPIGTPATYYTVADKDAATREELIDAIKTMATFITSLTQNCQDGEGYNDICQAACDYSRDIISDVVPPKGRKDD